MHRPVAYTGEQDHKLIAADAGSDVGASDALQYELRNVAENRVPGGVPVPVVDLLEKV